MRQLGTRPRSMNSNAFKQEMWGIFAGAVSICCFRPVARWVRGSWVSMSPALSRSWTLGQFPIPNPDCLAISPRAPSEKPELLLEYRLLLIRTFVLLHFFPPESQTCSRILEPCSTISFQLTGDRGATLLTKHMTYREDIRREWTFEEYTKAHYDSWVAFARDNGYGNAIKPVLVTGVDMTRDFAMMSYANDDDSDLTAEFTTSAPGASAWGTWQTTGVIYTNCGPQLCRPRPPAQAMDSASSGNHRTETVSDEYNQCIFVRYFTVRKRLGIPRVIKAAAGPHDLGPGGSHGGGSPPEVQYSSDSSSDIVSSPPDDDGDDDRSSITSVGSESDVVVHNTTPVRSRHFF